MNTPEIRTMEITCSKAEGVQVKSGQWIEGETFFRILIVRGVKKHGIEIDIPVFFRSKRMNDVHSCTHIQGADDRLVGDIDLSALVVHQKLHGDLKLKFVVFKKRKEVGTSGGKLFLESIAGKDKMFPVDPGEGADSALMVIQPDSVIDQVCEMIFKLIQWLCKPEGFPAVEAAHGQREMIGCLVVDPEEGQGLGKILPSVIF